MNNSYSKSYVSLNEMVEIMFPPHDVKVEAESDFNDSNFWKASYVPELDEADLV